VQVAAVVGRADLLSALCFLLAFIAYVCAVHSGLSSSVNIRKLLPLLCQLSDYLALIYLEKLFKYNISDSVLA